MPAKSNNANAMTRLPLGLLPLVTILGAAFTLRMPALLRPFFADDYLFLEQVRGRSLLGALLAPDPVGNFLRPVSRALYFRVVTAFAGESAFAFHAVGLALFLVAVTLVYFVTRRMAGPLAAAFVAGIVAVHYGADVPVLWASGSQDILALVFALGAILLHVNGRRGLAAATFFVALLSKEIIVGAAAIAIVLDKRPEESWRPAITRGRSLLIALGAWAALWLGTLVLRPAAGAATAWRVDAIPAALWHLVQVTLGLEFRDGKMGGAAPGTLAFGPIALVLLAVAYAAWRQAPVAGAHARPDSRPAIQGGWWALLATLPIMAVAAIWSAHFYLFALVGAGIAIAALMARAPRWTLPALAVALAVTSDNARRLDEYATAPGPWEAQSHVNSYFLGRGMTKVSNYLAQMRAEHPTLAPGTTIFFANVPPLIGWQTGSGPLVRWAYGDETLRSYELSAFTRERAERGPVLFFAFSGDTLRDQSRDPFLLKSFAFRMLLDEKPRPAGEALELFLGSHPTDEEAAYWLVWAARASGKPAVSTQLLKQLGMQAEAGSKTALVAAEHFVAAGDTVSAIRALLVARDRHVLDVAIHSRLAALCLSVPQYRRLGVIEAYVLRTLAPTRPDAWRKWASAQLGEARYEPAARSLDRYLALGGATAEEDMEVRVVRESLRRLLPGGDLAQQALHSEEL